MIAGGHGNRTPIHKHIQKLQPKLAHRVHLLLIVLSQLLTFSIHFIHCSEIIDVIQQNCGFDNCTKEIMRITKDQQTFCLTSYIHAFMDANVSILYVQLVFAFNKYLSSILCGFKQICTYILVVRDSRRLKPLEALFSYS